MRENPHMWSFLRYSQKLTCWMAYLLTFATCQMGPGWLRTSCWNIFSLFVFFSSATLRIEFRWPEMLFRRDLWSEDICNDDFCLCELQFVSLFDLWFSFFPSFSFDSYLFYFHIFSAVINWGEYSFFKTFVRVTLIFFCSFSVDSYLFYFHIFSTVINSRWS